MKAAPRPALEQGLYGPPPRRSEGDDGSTACTSPRLDPLLDDASRRHDDKNAVDDPLLEQSGRALKTEARLPRAGTRLDEDRCTRTEHGRRALLPATQRRCADGDRGGHLFLGGPFANALAPVAGDAKGLQVLHRGRAAARPRDNVIAFNEVAGNVAAALAARRHRP